MEMPKWEKQFNQLYFLTHVLYASPLVVVAALFFANPPTDTKWDTGLQIIFFIAAGLSLSTLALAGFIYTQLMGIYSLEFRLKSLGFQASFDSFRQGCLFNACVAEFSALIAVAFYVLTGNANRLWLLMTCWGIHYILSTVWMRKGHEDLARLARPTSMPSQARAS